MSLLIANALCPVFFVLALGYFAGNRKIVDNRNVTPLTFTLMNFALPASLFTSMATTSRQTLFAQASLVVALCVSMVLIYGATWAIQRRLRSMQSGEAAVQALTVAFPNCVAVGIPLLGSLFGPQGLMPVAIAIAIGAVTISPLTLSILEGTTQGNEERGPGARFARAVVRGFRKPVVLAPLLGLGWSFSGLHLPGLAIRMLTLIGQTTGGLALFLTGLIVSAHPLRMNMDVGVGTLLKNIVQVAMMLAIVHILNLPQPFSREAVLLAALPAGFFGTVFSVSYGTSPHVASSTLAVSTVFSIITLALAIFITRV